MLNFEESISVSWLFIECLVIFSCSILHWISSSLSRFTFCPGENVVLTSSRSHVWETSETAVQTVLNSDVPTATDQSGSIMFTITCMESGSVTPSTMEFTVSVDNMLISNGTWISCSSAGRDRAGRDFK